MVEKIFKSSNSFSMHIEKLATANKTNMIDAVIAYCETNMIEPSEIANKISQSLKDKLRKDFQDLNYLKKPPQLDIF